MDITKRKLTEEALRESETKLRSLFENSVDAIGVSKNGIHTTVNPAYLKLFGYSSPDEIIGKPTLYLIAPSEHGKILEIIKKREVGEEMTSAYETVGMTKNGLEFIMDVHVSSYKIRGEIYTMVILRDITERKHTEDALRVSKEHYQEFFTTSLQGIWKFEIQPPLSIDIPIEKQINWLLRKAIIAECNDVWAQMYGYSTAEDIIGTSLKELWGEDEEAAANVLKDFIKNDYSFPNSETLEPLKGGDFKWFMNTGFSIIEDGKVVRVWGTQIDITERKKAEFELKRYKDHLEELVEERTRELQSALELRKKAEKSLKLTQFAMDKSADAVYIIDPETASFLYANESAVKELGYSESEIKKLKVTQIDITLTQKKWPGFLKALKLSGYQKFETSLKNKDGKPIPAEIYARYIMFDDKDYIIAIARNITQRKQSEQKLQQSYKEINQTLKKLKETQSQLVQSEKMASLGQLTAGIAHEINNPINFVKGGSVALKGDFEDLIKLINTYSSKYSDKDIDKLKQEIDLDYLLENVPLTIEDIKTGADRTADIVKGLRSFTGLDEAEKKIVDIHECIDSTLVLISEDDIKHMELERKYQPDMEAISCFPAQLNQAFLNIINNARDVMKEGGKLTITTTSNEDQIIISFKDTGPGIPDDIKDKIFDPFFTTKEVGEGTGLGLSITHGIIEKHRGTIEVNSKEGQGSEFVITLPI